MTQTIAAIATAPGNAGVAVVRMSGPDAFAYAERIIGRHLEPGRVLYHDHQVVIAFKSPRSYTGEDVVGFQCHGGSVVPRRVLERCFAAGARLARRGEFTERAFLNGKLDLDQAESVLDLINAKTDRAADAALEGLAGRRSNEYRALYDRALAISTELEHALDVDEGELPPDFFTRIGDGVASLKAALESAIASARRRRILRDGALVVLAGAPNAGKSSLMNALLEENRAIVSDTPGTTRDSIEAWLDLDGFPVRLVDTAGLRDSADEIENEGVRRARNLIDDADLVIGLDCDLGLRVHSKCDLSKGEGINVSAVTGEGLTELKKAIVSRLAELQPHDDPRGVDLLLAALRQLDFPADDPTLAANALRNSAEILGSLIGATYSSDLLDNLFSRFCVGK